MSIRNSKSTTTLPQSLVEKIKEHEGSQTNPVKFPKKRGPSRKESRKQDREAKKQRKAQNHSHRPPVPLAVSAQNPNNANSAKRPAPQSREEEIPRKRPRHSPDASVKVFGAETTVAPQAMVPSTSQKSKKISTTVAPKSKTTTLSIDPLAKASDRAERDEARKIAWLEGQLGIKKDSRRGTNRYGADFAEDGLDELLIDVDRILAGTSSRTVTFNINNEPGDEEGHNELDSEAPAASVNEGSMGSSEAGDASDLDNASGGDDNSDEDDNGGNDYEDGEDVPTKRSSVVHADPDDDVPTPPILPTGENRYIPPHLRGLNNQEDAAEVIRLRRQIKGLLNRMSEQNIENLLNEFLTLYRANRRNDVTASITSLIIDGISSHSSLLDSYVILHATLVASLHKLIGIDFAAHFVESCISKYEFYYTPLGRDAPNADRLEAKEDQGKECMNLIVLISELYNFQVISCVLIYDLIRALLASDLNEINVELLLKITRNSGFQLRQDDPLALKDIVQLVQTKVAGKDSRSLSSRIRFMIETIVNLKNNKTKHPSAQQAGSESVARLRKFLAGLSKKHHVLAYEPLHVSLDDLHASDKKGKWWLVGSAWGGDPLVDAKHDHKDHRMTTTAAPDDTESTLLKLARKQGMNTDVRRSIFVVLVSSDDYVDACERMSQLNLTEIQQREIIRVVVHCCGNEKTYNPYYAMVGQHLCRTSHSFQVTLQYCLWDFLRDLGERDIGGSALVQNLQDGENVGETKSVSASKIHNVARAYAWWVAKGCTTLSILKAVDFPALQPQGQTFFKHFFAQLFLSSQSPSPVSCFTDVSADALPTIKDRKVVESLFLKMTTHHAALAQGIYRFVSRGHLDKLTKTEEMAQLMTWATDVSKETIRVGLDISG